MERYQSKQVKINHPVESVYRVLSDFSNFTPMIGDKVEDWTATEDSCSFKVKGFRVGIKIVEKEENKIIKLTNDGASPAEFFMWIQMVRLSTVDTRLRIVADVKLNAMMKMMLGKKLAAGVDQMAEKIAATFNSLSNAK